MADFINDSSDDLNDVIINSSCSNQSTSGSSSTAGSDVTHILYAVVGPTLLTVGVVGNCLILLTMTRRRMRGTSTCVYLVAMAILDLVVLVAGLVPKWLAGADYVDIKQLHPAVCKLEKFLDYAPGDAAVWVRVVFTFDRLVAVLVPLYVGQCCGQTRSARVYVIVAVVAAVAKNLHVFWTRGEQLTRTIICADNETIVQKEYIDNCGYPTAECKYFESYIRPWIAFALVSVTPFIIIAVCNTLIILALVMRRRNMKTVCQTVSNGGKEEQQFVQMAAMCVAASTLFLVCTAPSIVILIGKPYWNVPLGSNEAYEVAKAVCNLTFYVTFSANFFLYCITGDRFRSALRATFRAKEWCLSGTTLSMVRVKSVSRDQQQQPVGRSPRSSATTTSTTISGSSFRSSNGRRTAAATSDGTVESELDVLGSSPPHPCVRLSCIVAGGGTDSSRQSILTPDLGGSSPLIERDLWNKLFMSSPTVPDVEEAQRQRTTDVVNSDENQASIEVETGGETPPSIADGATTSNHDESFVSDDALSGDLCLSERTEPDAELRDAVADGGGVLASTDVFDDVNALSDANVAETSYQANDEDLCQPSGRMTRTGSGSYQPLSPTVRLPSDEHGRGEECED